MREQPKYWNQTTRQVSEERQRQAAPTGATETEAAEKPAEDGKEEDKTGEAAEKDEQVREEGTETKEETPEKAKEQTMDAETTTRNYPLESCGILLSGAEGRHLYSAPSISRIPI